MVLNSCLRVFPSSTFSTTLFLFHPAFSALFFLFPSFLLFPVLLFFLSPISGAFVLFLLILCFSALLTRFFFLSGGHKLLTSFLPFRSFQLFLPFSLPVAPRLSLPFASLTEVSSTFLTFFICPIRSLLVLLSLILAVGFNSSLHWWPRALFFSCPSSRCLHSLTLYFSLVTSAASLPSSFFSWFSAFLFICFMSDGFQPFSFANLLVFCS